MNKPQDFNLRPMRLAPADKLMAEMLPARLTVEQACRTVRALIDDADPHHLKTLLVSPLYGKAGKTWVEVMAENHHGRYTIALPVKCGQIGSVWTVITPKGMVWDVDEDEGNPALNLSVEELQKLTKMFAKEPEAKPEEKERPVKGGFKINKKGQVSYR